MALLQGSVSFSGRLIPADSQWLDDQTLGSPDRQDKWKWKLCENERLTSFYGILGIQHGKFCHQVYELASIKLYPTVQ